MNTSEPLDPKRPWITDPDDLPTGGITLRTMFSPFGDSGRIPFKRAYTIILFLSLPFALMLLMAATGSGGAIMPLSILAVLSVPLTIAHLRRLNHAGKNPLLAGIVVLPAVLGFGIFAITAPPHVAKANEIVAQIEADRADPEGAAKRRAEAARQARSSGSARGGNAQSRPGQSGRGGRGGRRGGGGWQAGGDNFNPTNYVLENASSGPALAGFLAWFIVTLWSLMWVARLPRANHGEG